ncbi:DUF2786 domain-containing protein [Neisseria gonorrhoeae]
MGKGAKLKYGQIKGFNMDKEKVLDKIKKCLALGRSANEHEAAQALRQAQALMEKYKVMPRISPYQKFRTESRSENGF